MSKYTDNTNEFIRDLIALSDAVKGVTRDIAVHAADLFDRNFEAQAFFGQKWKVSPYVERENGKAGKSRFILQKTGKLRKSIAYAIAGDTITFTSNLPYAAIHNEGGEIAHPGGTAYFYNRKKKQTVWVSNRRAEGKDYRRTKAHQINVPQRQFVGNSEQLQKEISDIIEESVNKLLK